MDVVELFDDLVAIRRTADVLGESLSDQAKDEIQAGMARIEGNLRDVLRAMSEDDRAWVIEGIDEEYNNGARAELEAML